MNPVITLLKPKTLAFRNNLLKSTAVAQRGQAIAIAGFSLIIMGSLFLGPNGDWNNSRRSPFSFMCLPHFRSA